jgi:dTDP-4-amino-4,6-dideoxygalactose transaminase
MYTIYIDEKKYGIPRDELIMKLKEKWIDSRQVFYPLCDMPPYKAFWKIDELSVSRDLAYNALNLPSSTKLKEEQITYICDMIEKFKK